MRLVIGDKNKSSWSLRPWLVMKRLGLAFEETKILLDRPETAAQIAQYSQAGKVPVLVDGDLTVWDSLAIIEYVADRFPEVPVWPADAKMRGWARAVAAEMHSGFATLRTLWPMDFIREGARTEMSDSLRRDIDRIDTIWRDCRAAHEADGPFLFGEFSAADAMYAPVVSRFRTYRGPSGDAAVDAYCETIWSKPEMREWGAEALAETRA